MSTPVEMDDGTISTNFNNGQACAVLAVTVSATLAALGATVADGEPTPAQRAAVVAVFLQQLGGVLRPETRAELIKLLPVVSAEWQAMPAGKDWRFDAACAAVRAGLRKQHELYPEAPLHDVRFFAVCWAEAELRGTHSFSEASAREYAERAATLIIGAEGGDDAPAQ